MERLPFNINFKTKSISDHLSKANEALEALNEALDQLSNPKAFLNALVLREAKDSSEIENISTTYEELLNSVNNDNALNPSVKDVFNYSVSIFESFNEVKQKQFININSLISIQKRIEDGSSGIRRMPGTVIKNPLLDKVIHTPPQDYQEILEYLKNLEEYINLDDTYDPLVNMAIIHYQFETIHPFYDANGRTGRILNLLYLVLKDKIDYPLLYLSDYILNNNQEYYKLLRESQEDIDKLEAFVIYMLKGIEAAAKATLEFINTMSRSMDELGLKLIKDNPKIYSQELIDFLYSDFYLTISNYKNKFNETYDTALTHLDTLSDCGYLIKVEGTKGFIYKNKELLDLMIQW